MLKMDNFSMIFSFLHVSAEQQLCLCFAVRILCWTSRFLFDFLQVTISFSSKIVILYFLGDLTTDSSFFNHG
jgi:hypothetical protein